MVAFELLVVLFLVQGVDISELHTISHPTLFEVQEAMGMGRREIVIKATNLAYKHCDACNCLSVTMQLRVASGASIFLILHFLSFTYCSLSPCQVMAGGESDDGQSSKKSKTDEGASIICHDGMHLLATCL